MDHKPGITLIELLVYIGVSTIVLLATTGLAYSLLATHEQTKAMTEVTSTAGQALTLLGHEIENAYSIDSSSALGIDLAQTTGSVTLHARPTQRDPLVMTVSDGALILSIGSQTNQRLTPDDITVTHFIAKNLSTANGRSAHLSITLTVQKAVGYGLGAYQDTFTLSTELQDYAP